MYHVNLPVSWDPPRLGTFKLNTDGACSENSGRTGLGGVIRDHDGNWVMDFYSMKPHTTPLHAELLALKKGLEIAAANNIKPIEIDVDAAELTRMFQIDNSRYHNLLFSCRSLMKATQAAPPRHIFREQNTVADALAKLGLAETNFGDAQILSTPPVSVEALVPADKLGAFTFHTINLISINPVCRDVATNTQ